MTSAFSRDAKIHNLNALIVENVVGYVCRRDDLELIEKWVCGRYGQTDVGMLT
jgi:hypothetical protein